MHKRQIVQMNEMFVSMVTNSTVLIVCQAPMLTLRRSTSVLEAMTVVKVQSGKLEFSWWKFCLLICHLTNLSMHLTWDLGFQNSFHQVITIFY